MVVLNCTRIPYGTVLCNGCKVQETPKVNLPPGAFIATRAETGGVNSVNIQSWAEKFVSYVIEFTSGGRKMLLIYDAFRAHISLGVL